MAEVSVVKLPSDECQWTLPMIRQKLVQVMALCQFWPRFMLPYGITRPQWINSEMQSHDKMLNISQNNLNRQPYQNLKDVYFEFSSISISEIHLGSIIWALNLPISLTNQIFIWNLIPNKKPSVVCMAGLLWWDSTNNQWIPCTKGQ